MVDQFLDVLLNLKWHARQPKFIDSGGPDLVVSMVCIHPPIFTFLLKSCVVSLLMAITMGSSSTWPIPLLAGKIVSTSTWLLARAFGVSFCAAAVNDGKTENFLWVGKHRMLTIFTLKQVLTSSVDQKCGCFQMQKRSWNVRRVIWGVVSLGVVIKQFCCVHCGW